MRFATSVALVLTCVIAGVPASPAEEPLSPAHQKIRDAVVDEILDGRTEGVRIVATPSPFDPERDEVVWSGGEIAIPAGAAWLAIADETPGVLGWHPVEHVFFGEDLEILTVRDATFYPRIYRDGDRQSWLTLVEYHARPGQVPDDRERASVPEDGREDYGDFSYNEHYAVIIEGDVPAGASYSEFWSDPVRMFRILLEYGYHEDNIHVLYGEGTDETDFACEYYREEMVDFPAYQQDVRDLFTWMRDGNPEQGIAKLTDQDFIYLFTFDHGGSSGGCDATLCLMDGCMPDTEFASYFNQIPYKHRGIMMQQCHSGGFIDNLENTTTAISTAANCTESAYEADERDDCGDGVDVKYGEFNYWWMSAMEGHLPWPGEEPVDADTNLDGKVSFLEAHNYAVENDDRTEHPQWSDLGNIGDDLSLVTSWAGAHLTHSDHTLDDAEGGNGDGIADAGETAVMPVTLQNIGEEDASGISATLSTDNEWITIEDAEATYPDMFADGGAGESFPDHYRWSSAEETPDDTQVVFMLDWIANGGDDAGTAQFYERIVRVILGVQQTSVQDEEGGNGDGIADPGESIRLAVTLRNKGHATARDVHGTLTTSSPYATVTDAEADFPDIAGETSGRSLEPHFGLDVAPDTPDKTWIHCTLDVTAADGYVEELPLKFMVGSRGTVLLVEDGDVPNADALEQAIGELGFGVERQLASETDPDSWSTYSVLAWASGSFDDPVGESTHRDWLEQHVAEGGRLLIEGGQLGYEHRYNDSFRENVLHMDSWYSHGGEEVNPHDPDHPMTTVPNLVDEPIGLMQPESEEEDAVRPTSDATVPYDWTDHAGVASTIAYDDDALQGNGGQIVSQYVAFDTLDDQRRGPFLDNALEWLLGNDLPYLIYDGHVIHDEELGNADGVVDPGEVLELVVTLANEGSGAATGVWAEASTDRPSYVTMIDDLADWPDLASGAAGASLSPHLQLKVAEDTPCGTVIEVELDILTAEGFTATRRFSFKVGTGGGEHVEYAKGGDGEEIPNPGILDSTIEVPEGFRIADVNCHVQLQHSSISLIKVVLASPGDARVTLHDRSGQGMKLDTIYDSQKQPDGPGSMSDYDGSVATGTWHLYVDDFKPDMMAGVLQGWKLIFDTDDLCHGYSCDETLPPEAGDDLTLERLEGRDVRLEWGVVEGASGYAVWRSSRPDMSDEHAVGRTEATTLDERGLPHRSQIYFYQVRAENGCREAGP
jgi:subtilisin-like proprotein convertase family protein